ncbi:patatin-like phospholipase family protein [Intestinibacter bartlettii]|uniref:Patatin-like phospholipase family protein n=1 Tax=Intestinibacter bartlettii TaxID=261299 RepID=A0ABS6DXM4_9FIRM|nr:patatin-like phospholipase family protein [Intestinibacter bartlettii]MBU5336529.1 patatin-like phospholipase family protein [Intestinibacter bartlettii]
MKGLVLEGGGTKGAYQLGAYKALKELGIEFDGIVGTSIGALNAAFLVQGDFETMQDIWLNRDYRSFMDIEEDFYEKYKNVEFKAKDINVVINLMNKARKNEGIDITPLKNLLKENIDEEKIRKSSKDFGLVTVYLDKKIVPQHLMKEDIPEGKLVDYLIASSSLPIFQLEKFEDKRYLDGFLSDNTPVGLLANKGYDDIIVIRLSNDVAGDKNLQKYADLKLTVIKPSMVLGGSLNKDKDHMEKLAKLGYMDTMKVFKRYDGVKYYFNADFIYDEETCFNAITNIDIKTIEDICKILKIKREPSLRVLLEEIVPQLGEILHLEKEFTYKDIFYSIYERKLEENNIDVLNLYDFSKVIDLVNSKIEPVDYDYENNDNKPIILLNKKEKNEKAIINKLLNDFKNQSLRKMPI